MPAPAKTTLHVPEPPRLGKRHDRESLGNDEFAFARKTISDWVDNESWPEDEAKPKKTRESGAISYKIQKLGSESSQGSPLTPKFGEKKLSLKKSIFQCLGDGAWEDGPMAQGCKSRTPSLGGEEMFTQLRKNTQDTIATRELSPLKEEFPTSSKKVASFFGADFRAVPFNLDDEESDGASSNGNNNPEPEPASQVKKSAKAILFNE
uniref:Uncharacterized protein n=1 Tax=Strombidium inclinatum TaxID=197538 RepID=A0A7S3MZ07_9SPIT|mmetsp:Transcript_23696/g.36371  ORF Transcript_23696/g.36371 Transcript_23696/m.36371 type:complete len:207 (+) Transcript_23696:599-1219(+)